MMTLNAVYFAISKMAGETNLMLMDFAYVIQTILLAKIDIIVMKRNTMSLVALLQIPMLNVPIVTN